MNWAVLAAALTAVIIFGGSAVESLSLIFILASSIIMLGVVLAFRSR